MTISIQEMALAEREISMAQQLREKITNEEFKIWKKTVPLLYDTIHTHVLDFPLSIQWLPDYTLSDNKNYINVKFLFGSNSQHHTHDYLKMASLSLPSTLAVNFSEFLPNSQSIPIPMSNMSSEANSFKILASWKHNGQINKLKSSPNYTKALTFDNQGIVHLFDLQSKDVTDFKYHKLDGNCLEWITNEQFLSGANDSQIALWDVSKPSTPIQLFKSHNARINDLSFNSNAKNIFGSVSDDSSTQFHDIRATTRKTPAIKVETTHIQNALEFHPDSSTLFATGGNDNVINLFDLRSPSIPFRKLFGHNGSVQGLKWDSSTPSTLISWGLDKRVITWDLNNLEEEFSYPTENQEQTKKKIVNKVDPCLTFIHGGHTGRINDVDIHPEIKNLFASVGTDNLLEIWKPKTIFSEEESMEDSEEESAAIKDSKMKYFQNNPKDEPDTQDTKRGSGVEDVKMSD